MKKTASKAMKPIKEYKAAPMSKASKTSMPKTSMSKPAKKTKGYSSGY